MSERCLGSELPTLQEMVVLPDSVNRVRYKYYGECPDCGTRFLLRGGLLPAHNVDNVRASIGRHKDKHA